MGGSYTPFHLKSVRSQLKWSDGAGRTALVVFVSLLFPSKPIAHNEGAVILHLFSVRDQSSQRWQTHEDDEDRNDALLALPEWLCRILALTAVGLDMKRSVVNSLDGKGSCSSAGGHLA